MFITVIPDADQSGPAKSRPELSGVVHYHMSSAVDFLVIIQSRLKVYPGSSAFPGLPSFPGAREEVEESV